MNGPDATISFELAANQSAIWFDQMLAPLTTRHHVSAAVRSPDDADVDLLRFALQHVVDSNPSLRTTFHDRDGVPYQTVHPHMLVDLFVDDASGWSDSEVENRLRDHHLAPFALDRGPLVRFLLLKRSANDHILAFAMHHLVSDMWSVAVLAHSIAAAYRAGLDGEAFPVADQRQTYQDFVESMHAVATGPNSEQMREYWRPVFEQWCAPLLTTDRPLDVDDDGVVDDLAVDLPPELLAELRRVAAHLDVSMRSLLLSAFHAVLRAHTGAEHIFIGELTANRSLSRTHLIGCCINQVARMSSFDAETTLHSLAIDVHTQNAESRPHERYPFAQLFRELHPSHGSEPFFSAMFAWQKTSRMVDERLASAVAVNREDAATELAGFRIEPASMPVRSSPSNLTLLAVSSRDDLRLAFEYRRHLFDPATIERLAHALTTMLETMVEDADTPVDAVDVVTSGERASWYAPRDNGELTSATNTVHQLVEQQARRTPDAIAVRIGSNSVTHQELDERANRLARRLRAHGVQNGDLIGLCLDRSIETIVSMLAVWKSGAGYVPMDATLPARRLAHMIDDADLRLIVTNSAVWNRVRMPTVAVDESVNDTFEALATMYLDAEAAHIAELSGDPLDVEVNASDVAYVFFTSGSTGQPKGVVSEHRNVANFLMSTIDRLGITADDIMLAATTFSFDPAVLEAIAPLVVGAQVDLVERDVVLDPALLGRAVDRVTLAQGTPTMWKMLLDSGWKGNPALTCLSGGEVLMRNLADELLKRCGAVWNLYGPTETTVWSSAARVGADAASVSIGEPIDNVHFHVLNERRVLVPTGRQGELWIGGAGVSRGYVGRSDLTAERFLDDPFGAPGQKMYRTGDLVRRHPYGRLEFRGRVDHQIKLRGHRIELGDVEAALEGAPSVARGVVVVHNFAGDERLVAYFTASDTNRAAGNADLDADAATTDSIRRHLRRELPAYMVPAQFERVNEFAFTASNKIDRNRLPEPTSGSSSPSGAPPRVPEIESDILHVVIGVFREVFGDDDIGPDDDFFDLGGHSLLATKIISRLRNRLGCEVPLRALFEQPAPRGLAVIVATSPTAHVTALASEDQDDSTTYALSFSQERMWLLHEMYPDSAAYNLATAVRINGALDIDRLVDTLRQIVDRHSSLRSRFVEEHGAPRVRVEPSVPFDVPVTDRRGQAPAEEQREFVRRAMEIDANQPFDLARLPLFRPHIYRLADNESVVYLAIHHIIADQWSFGVFAREIAELMGPTRTGDTDDPRELTDRPPRAELYGEWQRHQFEIGAHDASLAYWRTQLRHLPAIELPTDHPRPPIASTRGRTITRSVPPELMAQVRATAGAHNATEFMVMFTAFNALVHRVTGAQDVVVGVPIANRHWLESERLITSLVNTLVMRTAVSSTESFAELLEQVRNVALDAFAHQDVPFSRLVQDLAPERDLSRAPLFQLFFNMQNAPVEPAAIDGLDVEILPIRRDAAQFDLSLSIDVAFNDSISLEYATDLFDEQRMHQFLDDYISLVTEIAADVDARVNMGSSVSTSARATRASAPAAYSSAVRRAAASPRPGLERQVADVWTRVLGVGPIDRHDNFFDLGGHSILAIRVFAELEILTGRRPPLATLFRAPTLAGFAEVLQDEGWLSPWTAMIELRPGTSRPPLFYVAPFLVTALSLYELGQQLGDDTPMFVFQPQGLETDDPVHESVEDMAAHYIREMQTVQPSGPYSLGGHCAGGWVAFEMVRQLQASGHDVDHLIVVDIEPPGMRPPPVRWVRFVASRLVIYGSGGARGVFYAVKWKLGRSLERFHARRVAPAKLDRTKRVRDIHEEAHRKYQGGRIEGDMVLIRSEEWSRLSDKDWHLDWSQLLSGDLQVAVVSGGHARLLDGDAAVELAALIRADLQPDGGAQNV